MDQPGDEIILRTLGKTVEGRRFQATLTTRSHLSLVVVRRDNAAFGGRITVRPRQGKPWLWWIWGAPIAPASEIEAAAAHIARALTRPIVPLRSHPTASLSPLMRAKFPPPR